jgi:hypothetical protein
VFEVKVIGKNLMELNHHISKKGCKDVLGVITIKWTNGIKGFKNYNFFCGHFHFIIKKNFWDEIFCNMLLKIPIMFSIHHIFCLNFSWIAKNFFKVYRFNQILHFILKLILISNCMKIWFFKIIFFIN